MLDEPEDDIDQEKFSDHLCHVGTLLAEIFHQHSLARKSFITPLLNKSLKPTLNTTISDEWLYSEKFRDVVKEAKIIEKAVVGLKQPEKIHKTQSTPRNQGNWKYPPANWKQGGITTDDQCSNSDRETRQPNGSLNRNRQRKRRAAHHRRSD